MILKAKSEFFQEPCRWSHDSMISSNGGGMNFVLCTSIFFSPRLQWSHYDKRRGKPAFAGTKTFPDFESVLSECCKYGTLTGALDRFNRATSTRSAFQRVATRQVIAMHRYGYSPRKLLARLHHYSRFSPSKGRYSQAVEAITRMVYAWIARNDAAGDADR